MNRSVARMLSVCTLAALGFGLPVAQPAPPWRAAPAEPRPERTVFLGGGLTAENVVALSAALAAADHPGVLLLDSPRSGPYAKAFLAAFRPERVVPVGPFPDGVRDLEERLGVKAAPRRAWSRGPPAELWKELFANGGRLVVCPAEPRGQLLHAACLAGAERAPLFVARGDDGEADDLRRWLSESATRSVLAVGAARDLCRAAADGLPEPPSVEHVADGRAAAAAYLRRLSETGPVDTLVVANPEDGSGGMSALAPWVAVRRRAALLLTNDDGSDAEEIVRDALRHQALREADTLVLVATPRAIPPKRRPNPIPEDKDPHIEMEPMTPAGDEPFGFATGRLFHEDLGGLALLLARPRLLTRDFPLPRRALVASNPGGNLPLLEAFSRNTAQELRNAGYETTALFGKDVTRDGVRRLLPEYDVFLWEGHHSTLIRDYEMPSWDEPLPPSFVFLQSCLALTEEKALPLLRRGSVGVVGSSTRMYSASGGACSLAFFDAVLYDGQTLGGGLRQAKNFLLAYAQLKEKRLGAEATKSGANLRAAWAMTLWGDPAHRLPLPEPPPDARPAIRHRAEGNVITLSLPDSFHDKVESSKFRTEMRPNARLAGLLRKGADDDERSLVPFVFAEVKLPKAPEGRAPRLVSRVPENNWVFCWDGRRRAGYLLVTPRPRDQRELRFHVHWQESQ